jgi:predicted AAA+ superfamily ATPase
VSRPVSTIVQNPGLSVDTIKEYLIYLEMAFLVKPLKSGPRPGPKKCIRRKSFISGTMVIKTLLTGYGDEGSRAENAVFLELQRKNIACGIMRKATGKLIL